MEIKIGDVVRLKSGSPEMTVTEIENDIYISVIYWNIKEAIFETKVFMIDSLTKLD